MSRYLAALALLFAILSVCSSAPLPGETNNPPEVSADLPRNGQTTPAHDELLDTAHALEFTDTRKSYELALRSRDQARASRDVNTELAALLQAGKSARFLNEYTLALDAAQQGLDLAKRSKNEKMQGNFYLLIGYVKWNQSDLSAALANLLAAEKISRAENDVPLQIAVQSTLGLVDERNDNHASARQHLESAYQLAERTNDPQLASILNNLGSHYLGDKDFARAKEYFERALPLARPTGNQRLIAFLLLNLGQVALETSDYASADRFLADSLVISEQYHIRRGAADVYYLRGSLARKQNRLDDSRAELDRSLEIARGLNNPDLFATIYTEYVATEEASGRYREALEYARKLAEQKELIRGEKTRQQVAQLTAQYDAETRSQQIKLLQRDRELDQADLLLKGAELSRARARYSALALALVVVGLGASAFASRQRSRARHASLALAETRAAKEQVEEADANKARLLTIATQSLQESEARFRNAFHFSPLGMAIVGLDGRWIRVNPALCLITGYTEDELLAFDFQTITHPDDLSKDLDCIQRMLDGRIETYQLEKRYLHKAGHAVWTSLDVSLIRDPDTAEPKMFISQVQDITERRHVEEKLHLAKEEAELANAAKSEFLSRMSHELRTPLNAILGFGQLLEIQDLGTRSNQSVGQILTASRHLLELINEVLEISTIESGSFAPTLEPVCARDTVRGVIDLVLPLAEKAQVRVTAQADDDVKVLADPRRLKQVLLNLLSNAIKYNQPAGEVVVTTRVAQGRVRIEVRDTGYGIAPEDLETIFVPFSRLRAAQSVPGTGLGLSLTKVLTEAMHGQLSVRSEPGRGSTFCVELALCTEGGGEVEPTMELDAVSLSLFDHEPPPEATILYIEDNVTNMELVEFILADHPNVRVLSARDGATGLRMAADERPDLFLLDVHLPDMTGAEVLRRLRQISALSDVPVIVISADTSSRQAREMASLGASEYITKPFDLLQLQRAILDSLRPCLVG